MSKPVIARLSLPLSLHSHTVHPVVYFWSCGSAFVEKSSLHLIKHHDMEIYGGIDV
jgi:hypothetical protein